MRDSLCIRKHVLSIPFILGCLLITGGVAAGVWVDSSWASILGAVFAAVHVIALWLMVADAAKTNTNHAKTLTALSMFKFSAVLSMLLIIIVYGLLLLAVLTSFMSGFAFLFLLALIGGIGFVLIKFYYLALFNVLNAIRYRLSQQKYAPLDGLDSFLVVSYILIILGLIMSLVPTFGEDVSFAPLIIAIANGVGMILCLKTLKRYE